MDTAAERLAYLLDHRWHGNRSAMARDLGVTGAAIYKILKGQQNAGGKVLAGLEKLPNVNAHWVKTGEGDPLQQSVTVTSRAADRLPVFDRLLPGPPGEHQSRIMGHELWVASALVRPSRYLYRVGDSDPIVSDANAKVAAGDLLLIETEQYWLSDPIALNGKLVVLSLPTTNSTFYPELGTATWERARQKESTGKVTLPDGEVWSLLSRPCTENRKLRGLTFEDDLRTAAANMPLDLAEVCGVMMLLLRSSSD